MPKSKKQTKRATSLRAVYNVMAKHRLSLRAFLKASLVSQDSNIKRKVNFFYANDGPAEIIDLWQRGITDPEHMKSALSGAIEFVLHSAKDELREVTADNTLRLPSNGVCKERTDKFSLQNIANRFQSIAPTVYSLLNGLTRANKSSSRDATTVVPVIASILGFLYSNRCNYLQMMTGLYMFGKGAPVKLVNLFSKAGLSVSHPTIMRGLKALSTDSRDRIQATVREVPWYIVYDNINMASHKHHQRLGNRDIFVSGTTATAIVSNVAAEEEINFKPTQSLRLQDLMPTDDNEAHLRKVFQYHLVGVLLRNFKRFDGQSMPAPTKHLLTLEKTKTFPLPSMRIDQGTIRGNLEVLEFITEAALELPHEWFEGRRILIAGDQLTVSRLRSLKELRADDISSYHRLDWVIPVIQLFHLQMLLASTILRTHYGTASTPGSIAFNVSLLERKRVSLEKPDFHATNELLRESFDALVQRAWELTLLSTNLEEFAEGVSDEVLKIELMAKVDTLIDRFLLTGSLEILDGTTSRNSALFLRDMLFYLELSSAIKAGDHGRIEEILKWITIMFQAGSTKNYANELLHLHCGFAYSCDHWEMEEETLSVNVQTLGDLRRRGIIQTLETPHQWLISS